MKWVTPKRANVNRIACPGLIRRIIDPGDNDAEKLRLESTVYDALYARCRSRTARPL